METDEMELPEITEVKITAAHAYDYWATLAYYGHDYDETEIDQEEALANCIGWASRDQNEIIG